MSAPVNSSAGYLASTAVLHLGVVCLGLGAGILSVCHLGAVEVVALVVLAVFGVVAYRVAERLRELRK